ncbi:MAG: two-component regulator propeller domain-containing protein [Anaerolineae bacterium]
MKSYRRLLWYVAGICFAMPLLLHMQTVNAQSDTSPALKLDSFLRFAHLNSDDGLVQNSITAILQDRSGFMWFGTDGGLSRYDGYQFTTFVNSPKDENSLSSNIIRDLYEDHDGMIWIATEGGGMNRLDPGTTIFTHLEVASDAPAGTKGIPSDRHTSVFQDSRGLIWAGAPPAFGLTAFDPATQTSIIYNYDQNDPGKIWGRSVQEFIESDDHQIWMANDTAVVRLNPQNEQFTNIDMRPQDENLLKKIYQDSRGQIWAGGANGLYRYDSLTDNFILIPGMRSVIDMVEGEDGVLWLGGQNGLYRFDLDTQQLLDTHKPYAGISDSLSNSTITTLFRDEAGKIWIGGNNGLDIYDTRNARFDYYQHQIPGAPASFVAGQLKDITVPDNNTAWIAVDSTLHKVNLTTREVTVYRLEDYVQGRQGITALLQDHMGIVWIARQGGTLLQFDPVQETFTPFKAEGFPTGRSPSAGNAGGGQPPQPPPGQPGGPPPLPNSPDPTRGTVPLVQGIVALGEDTQNNLWVIFNVGGVYRLDATRTSVRQFTAPSLDPPPLPQATQPIPSNANGTGRAGGRIDIPVSSISIDRVGRIWFNSLNGIFRLDPQTDTYYRPTLLHNGGDAWTEANHEDKDGLIWIASREGLLRLDPQTSTVKQYTVDNGLPSNYLVGIQEDAMGDLWISSKKGIARFNPTEETFRAYDIHDGLQGNEFTSKVDAQAPDGRLFFGGSEGLTAFYPADIVDSTYQPPIILDDFELFNRSVIPGENSLLSKPIWMTDSLTLTHDQSIVSFGFAVLNYSFGAYNHYRYRLLGLENEWIETDSKRRFATYTNLNAGNYTFEVQAANEDGVWNSNRVSLAVTVLPPWWEEAWFRLAAALSMIAVVLAGYQWRVRSIKQRNFTLQQEVNKQTWELQERTHALEMSESQLRNAKDAAEAANRAKSAFLANMSHELRSPLNAILGFTQVTNRNPNVAPDVRENLNVIMRSGEHLLALINQVLDLSKIESGHLTLNQSAFDLYRLLDTVEEMFTLAAKDKHLKLIFERAEDVPQFIFADMTKLRQILINLIGNALKFTTYGSVEVQISTIGETVTTGAPDIKLQFEVADTGPGIATDELDRLFEPFAQTETGRRAQEGTGLGLTISRRFARMMGGDVAVTTTPGEGSTFTVVIACRTAQESELEATGLQERIIGLAPGQPRYRIMVVDDKWANRQVIVKLLTPLGFEVREAENGKVALEIAPTFQPHLIWMDIRMPVMDGMEATKQLRALPIGKTMKIIALTASVYEEEQSAVIDIGCDDFVRKPVHADTVFELLGRYLGVKYAYADAILPAAISHESLPHDAAKTALNNLPAELVRHLAESTELGDVAVIESTIAEIREHQPQLAATLQRLVQHFQFDALLALLKEEQPT